jgi:SAM-dependent methyltransferase
MYRLLTYDSAIADVFLRLLHDAAMPEYFRTAYRHALKDPERLRGNFLRTRHGFEMVHGNAAILLEAGCGFGHNAVWSVLLGAKHVIAVDVDPMKIQGCRRMAEAYGVADRMTIAVGDVHHLAVANGSVHAVINFECLEHFEDLPAFFREIARVLEAGGRFYGRTSANALSPMDVIFRQRFYRLIERTRFVPEREAMLRNWLPNLDGATIHRLAVGTRGLAKDAFRCRAIAILESRALPTSRFSIAVNPETGEWAERSTNPYAVAAAMRSAGFRASVLRGRHFITGTHWRRRAYNLIGKLMTLTHPLSLAVSPSIEVLGIKDSK